MFFRLLLVFISIGCSPLFARTVTIPIADLGRRAVAQNPGLAAARLRIEEAEGRLHNSGRLAHPELGGAYRQNIRTPERAGEISFTQAFPLTARLRLERSASTAELAAARAEVRNEERKIATAAGLAAVRFLAVRAQHELRATQLANSQQIVESTRRQLAAGQSSAAETTLTELEAGQISAERAVLDVELATVTGELRLLLGLSPHDEVAVTGQLGRPTAPALSGPDVHRRPDFQAAEATASAAQFGLQLERARRWSDLSLGLSFESESMEDAPGGLQRDEFLGLRFSLPLPLWNDNAGKVQEAAGAARRRSLEVDALRSTIRAETATASGEMQALARVVATLDDQLLPQATRLEELLRSAHGTGQTSLNDVLRARDRRFQLERQRIDALRDYHLARVRYDSAAGRHLPPSGTAGQ